MHQVIRRTSFLLSIVLLTGCNFVATQVYYIAHRAEWQSVSHAGGLKIGEPTLKDGRWWLPIDGNAASDTSFPKYYSDAKVKKVGNELDFYLRTRVNVKRFSTDRLKEIKLPKLQNGTYRLYYLNSDGSKEFIQEIVLQ